MAVSKQSKDRKFEITSVLTLPQFRRKRNGTNFN